MYYGGLAGTSRPVRGLWRFLATSVDRGESFERYGRIPVLDRTEDALLFRVIHSIMPHGDRWRAWYGAGARFEDGPFKSVPVYDIRHIESADGIHFGADGPVCIPVRGGDEHRVGRPSVIRHNNGYGMYYAVGTRSLGYRLGYRVRQTDHVDARHDDDIGIHPWRASGWDPDDRLSEHRRLASADVSVFHGNYGQTGFGTPCSATSRSRGRRKQAAAWQRGGPVSTTHGHAKYMGQALTSVLKQTRRPDRIIVINDGSPARHGRGRETLSPYITT